MSDDDFDDSFIDAIENSVRTKRAHELYVAISSGNVEKTKALVEEGERNVLALENAILHENMIILKYLLSAGQVERFENAKKLAKRKNMIEALEILNAWESKLQK